MPTADDSLRAIWGHGIEGGGDEKALKFLKDAGYRLTVDGSFRFMMPRGKDKPSDTEGLAIDYMMFEWDYGPEMLWDDSVETRSCI